MFHSTISNSIFWIIIIIFFEYFQAIMMRKKWLHLYHSFFYVSLESERCRLQFVVSVLRNPLRCDEIDWLNH